VRKWYRLKYAALFERVHNTKRIAGKLVEPYSVSGSSATRVHEPARGLEIVKVMGKNKTAPVSARFPRVNMRSRSEDGE
jgi:hypothetical protein